MGKLIALLRAFPRCTDPNSLSSVTCTIRNQMTNDQISLSSLFTPGEGGAPPFLAGREPELGEIAAVAERLCHKDPETRVPPSSVVIVGPRGNGKTVLMQEAVNRIAGDIQDSGQTPQVMNLTSKIISTKDELRQALAPASGWKRFRERLKKTKQIEVSSIKVSLADEQEPLLPDILAARASEGPMLIAVDEAHDLDPGVGGTLLDLVQNARTSKLPVLLMLAGTPALQDHLNRMQVSFWDRCLLMPIDRLDSKAAADALVKPLSDRGISFESDALDRVLEQSNGYPYFIQVWGQAVCWALMEEARLEERQPSRVSLAIVERAASRAETRVRAYYGNRYSELRRANLLVTAVDITALYKRIIAKGRPGRAYDTELTETIKGALSEEERNQQAVNEAFDQLKRLGFVWEVGDSFEPGIPSLMSYVADRYHAGLEAQSAASDNVPF